MEYFVQHLWNGTLYIFRMINKHIVLNLTKKQNGIFFVENAILFK